jgi:long-subunit fatty acid transport protein
MSAALQRRAAVVAGATGLATLLLTGSARAGIDYVSDLEAVAQAQAGAFVANPTTLAAVWYNPAGLAAQRGLQVEVEGGLVNCPLSYARAPDDNAASYPVVRNQTPMQPVALAGVSYDFGLPNLTAAFVAYVPQSDHYTFSDTGPQRYQAVSGRYVLAHFHLATAYRFGDLLALGVAFGPSYFSAQQRTVLSAALHPTDPEYPESQVPIEVDVEKRGFMTASIGATLTPARWLAIGAGVMPPFTVDAGGHAQVTLPPSLSSVASITGDSVRASVPFPTIARAGVRVWPTRRLSVELAGVYEGWSRVREIVITPDISVQSSLIGNRAIARIHLTKNYRDLASVRLGAEYSPDGAALRRFTFRGGVSYESSGLSPGYYDLSAADGDKYEVAVGASVRLWNLSIDLAYAHVFLPDTTESASKLTINNVVAPDNTRVIGNGTYSLGYDSVHVGVRVQLL